MSANKVSLKSPVTIAVVAVLLAGVVVLNLRTFGGLTPSGGQDRGYRLQAHPPVPSDVGQMVHHQVLVTEQRSLASARVPGGPVGRDPFFPEKFQPTLKRQPTRKKGGSRKTSGKPKAALECSAIMLGGISPLAIINGEGRRLGDKIQGQVVTDIDADGVTLAQPNGHEKRLPVGQVNDDGQGYRVVTRTRETDELGRTRLIDQ